MIKVTARAAVLALATVATGCFGVDCEVGDDVEHFDSCDELLTEINCRDPITARDLFALEQCFEASCPFGGTAAPCDGQ